MKFFSTVIVSFCVIGLLIGVTPIKADAGGKKSIMRGDICLDFENLDLDISGTLQLGVTHISGGHHLCSGLFIVNEVDDTFTAYGNLEIVEEVIYLTLSVAGVRDGIIGIDMIKAILDSGLYGTFESIGVYSATGSTGAPAVVELSIGTLDRIPCR